MNCCQNRQIRQSANNGATVRSTIWTLYTTVAKHPSLECRACCVQVQHNVNSGQGMQGTAFAPAAARRLYTACRRLEELHASHSKRHCTRDASLVPSSALKSASAIDCGIIHYAVEARKVVSWVGKIAATRAATWIITNPSAPTDALCAVTTSQVPIYICSRG